MSIEQLPLAIRTFTSSVKALGAVTVAFFLLLGFVIYLNASAINTLSKGQQSQGSQLERIEGKIDKAVDRSKENSEFQRYLLRQVCYNTAKTDQDRIACNPPPNLPAL